jgi:hypothetical protein
MQFADLVSVGPPAAYRITRASLERGLRQDTALPDILFLLARGAGQPLAGAVMAQLTCWGQELTVIRCEPGFRLRPAVPGKMAALRAREPFRTATELSTSGHSAFVSQAEAAALLRYLRRAGYVLSISSSSPTDAEPTSTLRPSQCYRLPLVSLATLIGFYTQLRGHVPGLADLRLDELERDLLAVLSPTEHAAVMRLIASNFAVLNASGDRMQTDVTDEAELVTTRIAPGAAHALPGDASKAAHWLEALGEVIAAGGALEIIYADTQGTVTQRRIRPLRLEDRWGRRYLVAHCELRGDERSFRLDRIVAVDLL